jgi:transposase
MEYAENVKARMVRRMLGPDAVTATSLAGETGISQATLSRWRAASIKGVSNAKPAAPTTTEATAAAKRPQDWTALERAQAVLAASRLDESQLGECLRRQGCTGPASPRA